MKSYPLEEPHWFLWIWMDDPALADPAKIPDPHWKDDPEGTGDGSDEEKHENQRMCSCLSRLTTSRAVIDIGYRL